MHFLLGTATNLYLVSVVNSMHHTTHNHLHRAIKVKLDTIFFKSIFFFSKSTPIGNSYSVYFQFIYRDDSS